MHMEPDIRPDLEGRTKRRRRGLVAGALTAAMIVGSAATATADRPIRGKLGQVRDATAQYHRVSVADDAGYQLGWRNPDIPINGCVAHPTDGAMGYHWFDHDAIDDPTLDPLRPEGLVYERLPNGELHLVAVEWIVPADVWHADHDEPPSVLGQEMGILNPALGWYILHAWIWKPNPSGMFVNWNPDVSCP